MKIKDRLVLGMISGIIGNVGKFYFMKYAENIGYSTNSFTDTAAAFFLHRRDIRTPLGQLTGNIADFSISLLLGIPHIYLLCNTGKKHWLLKGIASGSILWVAFYGFLGTLGKSNLVYPTTPRTAFSSYLGHVLFGILSNYTAIKLGHDELFAEPKRLDGTLRKSRPLKRTKRLRPSIN